MNLLNRKKSENMNFKGSDNSKNRKNSLGGYKILSTILVILIMASFATGCSGGTDKAGSTPPLVSENAFSDGTYLVNKDIPSGLYKVILTDTLTKNGYVQRASDESMELSSIIADVSLTGNGYIEILNTDVAVKIKGLALEPIKIEDLKPALLTEASGGVYLVGYDLAPGTYKIQVTDMATNSGTVKKLSSVAMGPDDIISSDIISKSGTLTIEEGVFAVSLQGVKITAQN